MTNRTRKKLCDCGKVIPDTQTCLCKKKRVVSKEERERNKELTTARWAKFRKRIINRDNYCCTRCLNKYNIINSERLEVHHIKPRIKYPTMMYIETNCVTLCRTCNMQIGTAEQLDYEYETKEIECEYNL